MWAIARHVGFVLVLSLCGCGSASVRPEHVKTVPVSGILTFQGNPLPDFQVVFTPTDGSRPARGKTDAAGKFVLGTNKPGDGSSAGTSKISVAFDPVPEIDSSMAEPIDDPRKMPKPKANVPAKYNNPETSELVVDVPAGGLSDYKLELQ